jgi:hypothetical protein
MAGSQARLQITIDALNNASADVKGLSNDLKDVNESANKSSEGFKVAGLSLTDLKSGVDLAMGGLEKLKQVWDFAKQGAENERVADSFKAAADSVSVDANRMADELNKAARGTVDDEVFMQTATRNMALGMATDLKSNVALMELARQKSINFGGDTETAFEGISEAIGNLQTRQLKQYGIIVDTKEANETYAKAIGKTADQLTEAEQRTALLNDVMLKSKDIFKNTGDAVMTSGEKFKAFEVKVGNLVDVAKQGAVEGFTPWLDRLSALEIYLDTNATETDKLRVTYENLKSMGIDPSSASMELLRQKIEEADTAMQAISMTTGETAVRANMANVKSLEAVQTQSQYTRDGLRAYAEVTSANTKASQDFSKWLEEGVAAKMSNLNTIMAGAVKNEMEDFAQKQDALKTKAEELQTTISTSYGKIKADSITELGLVNAELEKNAAKHEDATNRILYGYLQQAIAAEVAEGKMTATEGFDAAMSAAIDLGIVSAEDATAIGKMGSALDTALFTKDWKGLGTAIKEALNPPVVPPPVADYYANMYDASRKGYKAPEVDTSSIDAAQAKFDALSISTAARNFPIEFAPITKTLTDATTTAGNTQLALDAINGTKGRDMTVPYINEIDVTLKNSKLSADNLREAINKIQGKDITVKVNYVSSGEPPSGGGSTGNTLPSRALGGPTGQGGLFLLHPNEFVLSEAMRTGRAPIPAGAVPTSALSGSRTVINNVNLYDTLTTKMFLEQQRVDDLRRIEGMM